MNALRNTFTGTKGENWIWRSYFYFLMNDSMKKSISGMKSKHLCYERTHKKTGNLRKTLL